MAGERIPKNLRLALITETRPEGTRRCSFAAVIDRGWRRRRRRRTVVRIRTPRRRLDPGGDGSNRRRDDDPVRTVPAPTDPRRSFTLDGVLLLDLLVRGGGGGRARKTGEREETGFWFLILLLILQVRGVRVVTRGGGGDEASSRSERLRIFESLGSRGRTPRGIVRFVVVSGKAELPQSRRSSRIASQRTDHFESSAKREALQNRTRGFLSWESTRDKNAKKNAKE